MKKNLFNIFLGLFLITSGSAVAQSTTLTTVGTLYDGFNFAGVNSAVTFALVNNNTTPQTLTDVGNWQEVVDNGAVYTLWYHPTSIIGAPTINAANGWTAIATSAPVTVASAGITPIFSNLNFNIPAGVTWRFAVQSDKNVHYSGSTTTTALPNIFSGGGIDLITSNNAISPNWAGLMPGPLGFSPRSFTGFVTFKPAIKQCIGVADGGVIVASDTALCAGKGYDYTVINNTHSRNTLDTSGYTWYWESSIDGAVWSFLSGSVDKDTISGIFNDDVWYRMYVICSFGNDTVKTNTVHIKTKASEKCYCYSQSTGGNTDSSDIGALTIYKFSVDLKGPHLLNPLSVKRRTDYTDLPPIELYIDSSYKFEIKHIMKGNFHHNAKITVFMDFNNNQVYDVEHERVFTGFTNATSFVLTPVITIPDSAIEKIPTGMRIIINDDAGPNAASDSACGGYVSGETEDYMVLFQRAFPTNVSGLGSVSSLNVYPNPSSGKVAAEFRADKDISHVNLAVYNLTGQQLMQEDYDNVGHHFKKELDISSFAAGVYILELNIDGNKKNIKLTKN